MTYVVVPTTDFDPDSPLTTGLMGNIINNITHTLDRTHYEMSVFGDGQQGSIVWSGSGSIDPGVYFYQDFTINSGVTVSASRAGNIILFCSGTCTITGTLNFSGAGYAGGVGQDAGTALQGSHSYGYGASGGGGADSSGTGADGGHTGMLAGDIGYMTAGGAHGASGSAGATAESGVAGSFNGLRYVARGRLTANLMGAGGGGGGSGGGGSGNGGAGGGGVIICANTIAFPASGVVNTSGANATLRSGGGGGGGQVWVAETYSSNAGTRTTAGGTSPVSGGSGGSGGSLVITSDPTA